MTIDTQHEEYKGYASTWEKCESICEGDGFEKYIEEINPHDTTRENKARNKTFKSRAVFMAIAGQTARGMKAVAFKRAPAIELTPSIEYAKTNISGEGIGLAQHSQEAVSKVVITGRAGILTDYPQSDGIGFSQADINAGIARATVRLFCADDIINWDYKKVGADSRLSLVVLKDSIKAPSDNPYSSEKKDAYLELYLDEYNFYAVRIWAKLGEYDKDYSIISEWQPTDGAGKKWEFIPFDFIGAESNSNDIDMPPMLDIVRVNIGHLNNSAIYEDSVYQCGQPQPWASGIDFEAIETAQAAGFYWGSGRLFAVPSGESIGIVQAQPNTMARQAMIDKVDMAMQLGARMIQPGSAVKTATQIDSEREISHSVLSLICANVSEAYTRALRNMDRYNSIAPSDPEAIKFEINQDFMASTVTAQDRQVMAANFLQGLIPWSDWVRFGKAAGDIDPAKTADEVLAEIEAGKQMAGAL